MPSTSGVQFEKGMGVNRAAADFDSDTEDYNNDNRFHFVLQMFSWTINLFFW